MDFYVVPMLYNRDSSAFFAKTLKKKFSSETVTLRSSQIDARDLTWFFLPFIIFKSHESPQNIVFFGKNNTFFELKA